MSHFNLTKAEIVALSEQNQIVDSGHDQDLSSFFQSMSGLLEKHISHILGTQTTVDGFYIEKIVAGLDNLIKDAAYIFPIELLYGDSYVVISESDAETIGKFLNVSTNKAINLIFKEFVFVFTEFVSEHTSYWQQPLTYPAVLMSVNQIKSLSVGPSHFARYNVYCDSTGFEILHFLPNQFIRKILAKDQANNYNQQQRVCEDNHMRLHKQKKLKVTDFHFEDLNDVRQEAAENKIDLVNDVTLEVIAELGQSVMTLGELMKLTNGEIITLDKIAGEPADIYVNEKLIAKAEISVVDTHFGLRILEITNARDSIKY